MTSIAGVAIILLYGYKVSQIFPDNFFMGIVLGIINSFFWVRNQNRFSRLEKETAENNNLNKDNKKI